MHASPILNIYPSYLNFGSTTTIKTFSITNIGIGTLTYSITPDQSWITVVPSSGSTTNEVDMISVTIKRSNANSIFYTGSVNVTSNGGNKTLGISMLETRTICGYVYVCK